MAEKAKGTKKKFQVPHILVIIGIIVLVACLRTYIAPVGEFDLDEAGNAIAGTYHAVERTTVSPWQALLMVKKRHRKCGVYDFAYAYRRRFHILYCRHRRF